MIKYTVRLQSKSGKVTTDTMNADDENQLQMLAKMQGLMILEVVEKNELTFENVANVNLEELEKSLNNDGNLRPLSIEEQAMRELAMETNPELRKQIPGTTDPFAAMNGVPIAGMPQPQTPSHSHSPAPTQAKPLMFEDKESGTQYKIVAGVVYKKDWVQCDSNEFKIIRKASGRLTPSEELIICKLDWVKMEEEKEDVVEDTNE